MLFWRIGGNKLLAEPIKLACVPETAGVEVAELEALVQYLQIPIQRIWHAVGAGTTRRVVRVRPGEIVQIVGELSKDDGGSQA